ncbi:DUF3119 family protein [Leptothoe sp. PORK10 BA2]|uniref:DUF3119 family protein n=1 Tax=Leptothoe sp. PORK10 BA2 TaxID=3110254 RepID=UPI002B1EF82E|nr:DUF3119 family protein [Leptothoe sp. PORK10 BA2]MEA5466377.1 DUF3119 family protein [Leptothoe sp. PORK10 BA2]
METLSPAPSATTTLSPDYRLSLSVLVVGLCLVAAQSFFIQRPCPYVPFMGLCLGSISLWGGLLITLLGLFLGVQTTLIRLTFTETELQVCRGTTILRQFPYEEWQIWTFFWQPVPILFYFREVKSIHFLPMLFSPTELRHQLNQHCATVGTAK